MVPCPGISQRCRDSACLSLRSCGIFTVLTEHTAFSESPLPWKAGRSYTSKYCRTPPGDSEMTHETYGQDTKREKEKYGGTNKRSFDKVTKRDRSLLPRDGDEVVRATWVGCGHGVRLLVVVHLNRKIKTKSCRSESEASERPSFHLQLRHQPRSSCQLHATPSDHFSWGVGYVKSQHWSVSNSKGKRGDEHSNTGPCETKLSNGYHIVMPVDM